jgi:hypothetical protein
MQLARILARIFKRGSSQGFSLISLCSLYWLGDKRVSTSLVLKKNLCSTVTLRLYPSLSVGFSIPLSWDQLYVMQLCRQYLPQKDQHHVWIIVKYISQVCNSNLKSSMGGSVASSKRSINEKSHSSRRRSLSNPESELLHLTAGSAAPSASLLRTQSDRRLVYNKKPKDRHLSGGGDGGKRARRGSVKDRSLPWEMRSSGKTTGNFS